MIALLNTEALFSGRAEEIDLVRDCGGEAVLFESFGVAESYSETHNLERVHFIDIDFNASVYNAAAHLVINHKHMEIKPWAKRKNRKSRR
jgi:hypothetical protein